jgi:hypothetical protein
VVALAADVAHRLPAYSACPFIYAAMRAIEWRWWVSGIRIGEVGFHVRLAHGAFIGLYWKVIGWCVAALIGLGSGSGAFGDRIRERRRDSRPSRNSCCVAAASGSAHGGFGYLVAALAVGASSASI